MNVCSMLNIYTNFNIIVVYILQEVSDHDYLIGGPPQHVDCLLYKSKESESGISSMCVSEVSLCFVHVCVCVYMHVYICVCVCALLYIYSMYTVYCTCLSVDHMYFLNSNTLLCCMYILVMCKCALFAFVHSENSRPC